jgi:hypothetical protein
LPPDAFAPLFNCPCPCPCPAAPLRIAATGTSSHLSGPSNHCNCSAKLGVRLGSLASDGTRTKRAGAWIFRCIVAFFISHQVNCRCDWSAVVPGLLRWLMLDNHLEENELPVLGEVALTDRFATYIAARRRTVSTSAHFQLRGTGDAPTSWCLGRHRPHSTGW